MNTIRVGVVGAGRNTIDRHIPGLQAIEGVEVVSVCNRSRASSERVARQFDIPTVYESWTELIEAPDTDAIMIGTWPYMHCAMTLAAISAGKHLLCEARMAMNADEAQIMRDAAHENPDLVAQIVPSPVTLWADKTLSRLIAEGYVGDLLTVEIRSSGGTFLDKTGPLHWRKDFDLSGMNIMSMGIWYEAMIRWVGEATRVMAMGKTFVKMRKDENTGVMRAVRVPEHVEVLMDLACGAQGCLSMTSVQGLINVNEIILCGSEGTLCVEGETLYGGRRGDDELHEIAIAAEDRGSWRVEAEFIGAIRGQEKVTHTTFDDGLKYMQFTEAVYRSIAEGKAISLPL
ncbi:MAG: Gfo/Idh/MocA family oxidoreductase [candidate division Zixibacteria bacterium]|nr:Gfo/Idh/MocA family oxidoreductase [candidate division Zixibacteria bacterium]